MASFQTNKVELKVKEPEFLAAPAYMEKIEKEDQDKKKKWRRKRQREDD